MTKELLLSLSFFQRFIMLLTEHLVRCETSAVDINTSWYKNCIERLQQIFLMVVLIHVFAGLYCVLLVVKHLLLITFNLHCCPQHHVIIQQYIGTLENLLFTAELDHHILAVYQQFCALHLWNPTMHHFRLSHLPVYVAFQGLVTSIRIIGDGCFVSSDIGKCQTLFGPLICLCSVCFSFLFFNPLSSALW